MKAILRALIALSILSAGLALFLTERPAQATSTNSTRALYDMVFKPAAAVCANNAATTPDGGALPASCSLVFEGPVAKVTCSDVDGCSLAISESGAEDGKPLSIVNVSSNAVTVSDVSGVSELAGSAVLGQWDSLHVLYVSDRWVEMGRSNN